MAGKKRTAKPRWTQPPWMGPYVDLIGNTGGRITPEDAMNCDGRNCNMAGALICTGVWSQVTLLERLHARALLARLDGKELGREPAALRDRGGK